MVTGSNTNPHANIMRIDREVIGIAAARHQRALFCYSRVTAIRYSVLKVSTLFASYHGKALQILRTTYNGCSTVFTIYIFYTISQSGSAKSRRELLRAELVEATARLRLHRLRLSLNDSLRGV